MGAANRVFARIRKCEMHIFSQAFANMLSQKHLGFASFANMISHAFASFRSNSQMRCKYDSQYFASFRNSGFASFRKLSQGFANGLSQGFAKDSQVRKSWFFARIRNGHFADGRPSDSGSESFDCRGGRPAPRPSRLQGLSLNSLADISFSSDSYPSFSYVKYVTRAGPQTPGPCPAKLHGMANGAPLPVHIIPCLDASGTVRLKRRHLVSWSLPGRVSSAGPAETQAGSTGGVDGKNGAACLCWESVMGSCLAGSERPHERAKWRFECLARGGFNGRVGKVQRLWNRRILFRTGFACI